MLIIPAENAVNWKRPPWATLGLIFACLLVFLFYQGGDDRKMDAAISAYLESDLLALEAPAYEDYLQRQIQFEGDSERLVELQDFQTLQEEGEDVWQAVTLLMDREFYQYLQANQQVIWAPDDRAQWQQQRSAIEADYISQISSLELGLIPAELSLYTLITYQFLHGGWGHIIGNLLFLFLLGFTVEKALGPGKYLAAYLA
ncbi:MAG: rhomboid family intramembrane serine protease, partial [Marinobacter sp. 34-60-7]